MKIPVKSRMDDILTIFLVICNVENGSECRFLVIIRYFNISDEMHPENGKKILSVLNNDFLKKLTHNKESALFML